LSEFRRLRAEAALEILGCEEVQSNSPQLGAGVGTGMSQNHWDDCVRIHMGLEVLWAKEPFQQKQRLVLMP